MSDDDPYPIVESKSHIKNLQQVLAIANGLLVEVLKESEACNAMGSDWNARALKALYPYGMATPR